LAVAVALTMLLGFTAKCFPDDPLDLAPAVEDTRQVFRDHGLPVDWYASLKPGAEGSDPLLVTGIWTMVGTDVANKFQKRFKTQRAPESTLDKGEVICQNPVFEEVVLLALIGPDHEHTVRRQIQAQVFGDLPNVDAKFLKPDGAVKFNAIRDAFVTRIKQGPPPRTVNDAESVASDANEFCRVVGGWQEPTGNPPTWASNQVAWRPVIRVEFVDGERKLPGRYVHGKRRLVIGSYVQLAYRRDRSKPFTPIHFAGPFDETAYQPVGKAQTSAGSWKFVTRRGPCKKTFAQSELDSLNRKLNPEEQNAAAKAAADKTPVAERPSLTSVGGHPDIQVLHRELDEVLIQKKRLVP